MDKLLGALSLCRKAGRLAMGFDPAAESMAKGKAQLVLFAADLAPGSEKKARRLCGAAGVPARVLPFTQQQLLAVMPKKVGVFAVTEPGLAKLVESRLQPPAAQDGRALSGCDKESQ